MTEIERKFLVDISFIRHLNMSLGIHIQQGYICDDIERSVRVRRTDKFAYLTIKGKGNESGLSRYEFETPISLQEADDLLKLCINSIIDKTRFNFTYEGKVFEVDIFHKENLGLIVAEVELKSENEKISKPEWVGEEVTGQDKYYNLQLSKNPYRNW